MSFDAFLLAGGLGTRMGPLSRVLPKPAWTLRGESLLQWGASSLRHNGFTRIGCNAHLHIDQMRCIAQGLTCFEEPELLGSAGGLLHVRGRIEHDLLVWNADAIGENIPWTFFRERHRAFQAQLSWLLLPHPGGPWSQVWLDDVDRVLPRGEKGRGPFLFTGASCWSREALGLLPNAPSEVRELLPRLNRHRGVVVEPFPWWEVGTPGQLIVAAADLAPKQEGRLASCYVHPTAAPNGDLERCVLGPGAAPPASIRDEGAFWYAEEDRQIRLPLSI
jgi:NDP-sugar pyrophosphorylase family protein